MQLFFLKNHKLTRTTICIKTFKIHKEFNMKLLYHHYAEKTFKKMMPTV